MPSLWTPDGERNVERESPAPAAEPTAVPPPSGGPGAAPAGDEDMALSATELKAQAEQLGIDLDSLSPEERAQAEAAVVEMAATRARLAETPAAEVIANHLMGFYELGAIHLSRQPPAFEDAALAIDALRAVLERVGDGLTSAAIAAELRRDVGRRCGRHVRRRRRSRLPRLRRLSRRRIPQVSDTPTPFPPAGPQLGTVEAFDSHACLGTIVDTAECRWPFQCTALADGSREVEPGTPVTFVVARRHGGTFEADRVAPLPSADLLERPEQHSKRRTDP